MDSGGAAATADHVDGPLTVNTDGGSLQVDGAPGADIDSGGGPVTADHVDGPLTVNTDGGSLQVDGAPGQHRSAAGR